MKRVLLIITTLALAGCSVFGHSNVESAPYTLIKADERQNIEVRNYDTMILVSTDMSDVGRNRAFRKLFNYIAGNNEGSTEISMTAPVLMDQASPSGKGTEISMTAPVLMNNGAGASMMSFVMPKDFTLQSTPKPSDSSVIVSELSNYKVAAIQFNGTLSKRNVAKHTKILTDWMAAQGYTAAGEPVEAGYNGPLTLPMLRRNEIMIELE